MRSSYVIGRPEITGSSFWMERKEWRRRNTQMGYGRYRHALDIKPTAFGTLWWVNDDGTAELSKLMNTGILLRDRKEWARARRHWRAGI